MNFSHFLLWIVFCSFETWQNHHNVPEKMNFIRLISFIFCSRMYFAGSKDHGIIKLFLKKMKIQMNFFHFPLSIVFCSFERWRNHNVVPEKVNFIRWIYFISCSWLYFAVSKDDGIITLFKNENSEKNSFISCSRLYFSVSRDDGIITLFLKKWIL